MRSSSLTSGVIEGGIVALWLAAMVSVLVTTACDVLDKNPPHQKGILQGAYPENGVQPVTRIRHPSVLVRGRGGSEGYWVVEDRDGGLWFAPQPVGREWLPVPAADLRPVPPEHVWRLIYPEATPAPHNPFQLL